MTLNIHYISHYIKNDSVIVKFLVNTRLENVHACIMDFGRLFRSCNCDTVSFATKKKIIKNNSINNN